MDQVLAEACSCSFPSALERWKAYGFAARAETGCCGTMPVAGVAPRTKLAISRLVPRKNAPACREPNTVRMPGSGLKKAAVLRVPSYRAKVLPFPAFPRVRGRAGRERHHDLFNGVIARSCAAAIVVNHFVNHHKAHHGPRSGG